MDFLRGGFWFMFAISKCGVGHDEDVEPNTQTESQQEDGMNEGKDGDKCEEKQQAGPRCSKFTKLSLSVLSYLSTLASNALSSLRTWSPRSILDIWSSAIYPLLPMHYTPPLAPILLSLAFLDARYTKVLPFESYYRWKNMQKLIDGMSRDGICVELFVQDESDGVWRKVGSGDWGERVGSGGKVLGFCFEDGGNGDYLEFEKEGYGYNAEGFRDPVRDFGDQSGNFGRGIREDDRGLKKGAEMRKCDVESNFEDRRKSFDGDIRLGWPGEEIKGEEKNCWKGGAEFDNEEEWGYDSENECWVRLISDEVLELRRIKREKWLRKWINIVLVMGMVLSIVVGAGVCWLE